MSHRTKIQKLLKKQGFELIRNSKHLIYRNETGQTVVVPNHNRMNIITYRKILKQIEGAA